MVTVNDEYDVRLLDDGTLNTVIEVSAERWDDVQTYHYSQEAATAYRDEDGCLDLQAFANDVVIPDIEAEMEE